MSPKRFEICSHIRCAHCRGILRPAGGSTAPGVDNNKTIPLGQRQEASLKISGPYAPTRGYKKNSTPVSDNSVMESNSIQVRRKILETVGCYVLNGGHVRLSHS